MSQLPTEPTKPLDQSLYDDLHEYIDSVIDSINDLTLSNDARFRKLEQQYLERTTQLQDSIDRLQSQFEATIQELAKDAKLILQETREAKKKHIERLKAHVLKLDALSKP